MPKNIGIVNAKEVFNSIFAIFVYTILYGVFVCVYKSFFIKQCGHIWAEYGVTLL